MKSQPFARALAMMAAITQAMRLPQWQQQGVLAQIGPYISRGKGRGKAYCRSWASTSGSSTRKQYAVPVGGGRREVARRQRQIAIGTLQAAA